MLRSLSVSFPAALVATTIGLGAPTAASGAQALNCQLVKVISGDSFIANCPDMEPINAVLANIAAPSHDAPNCVNERITSSGSIRKLESLLTGRMFELVPYSENERETRVTAFIHDDSVGGMMLSFGWAKRHLHTNQGQPMEKRPTWCD